MDAPLRSLRSLGGKYNKELASSHIISRDSGRLVGSFLTVKSDGAPPPNREEEQKRTLLPNWTTISPEKNHLHLGTPNP